MQVTNLGKTSQMLIWPAALLMKNEKTEKCSYLKK